MVTKQGKLFLGVVLAGSLIFGSGKALAQNQYDACDTANPNYSTECRDESKRDFAKVGEIDYRNVLLLESGRVNLEKSNLFPNYQGVDYDPYTKKAVCSVNIAKKGEKFELFIMDANLEGNKLTIDETNKERVTYDAVTNHIANLDPFWTKDRTKIMYYFYDDKEAGRVKKAYVINRDGTNKRKIDYKEVAKLYSESHDKKTGMINVPPSN